MSFIPKNPLSLPEIKHTPSTPSGTRGLFAKEDGWYEVDSSGEEQKFTRDIDRANSFKYYGDAGIVPSDQNLFNFQIDKTNRTAMIVGTYREFDGYIPADLSGDIVIPYEYKIVDGDDSGVYKITQIGEYALHFSNITSIRIPNTITSIGDFALQSCTDLTNITIADSVISIGKNAFYNCKNLKRVILSNNIITINEEVFSGCSTLVDISIPPSVTTIENGAFRDCVNIKSITISKNINAIHDFAFENNRLTSIYFGGSKEQWDMMIGYGINSLIGIPTYFNNVPATEGYVTGKVNELNKLCYYGDGQVAENDMYLQFSYIDNKDGTCTINGANGNSIESIVVPYMINNLTVTSIADSAFSSFANLKNVIIPKSIKTIGVGAFSYCGSLTSIIIPDSVTSIGDGAFSGCTSLKTIQIPKNLKIMENNLFNGSGLTYAAIPEGIESIGWGDFYNCKNLKSVSIPNSVTDLGWHTFEGCSNLTNIIIPPNVTSIGEGVFSGCTNLKNITIPKSVTSVEYGAFDGCDNLVIICEQNSFGEEYAKDNNIPYVHDVTMPSNIISVTITGGEDNWIKENVVDANENVIGTRYGQVVTVANATITPYSKVDLQISSEQMVVFYEKSLAFVAENDNGVVTVYCIGSIPENDYTIQATITEVVIDG